MPKLLDRTGQRFGRLLVLRRGENHGIATRWVCQCDCGKETLVAAQSLKSGATKSCGCFREESTAKRTRTHGHFTGPRKDIGSPTYRSYLNAKSRCTYPRVKCYNRYGGRGIRFLFTSFQQFLDELGPRPEGKTLDRKDVNGHYEPGNVRWATDEEQRKNRRPEQRDAKGKFAVSL